jgi:hypothetical protein
MNTARHGNFLVKQAGILLALGMMVSLLAACSGSKDEVAARGSDTIDKAANAALTPLDDIGIKRDEIPQKLQELVENPYSVPKPLKCATIKEEIASLDTLVGPDFDAPKVAISDNEKYAIAGGELIEDGIVGFVRSQTSFIPFRGILRSITGAKAHEKAIAKAKEAGKIRRAYLKGLASAKFGKSCPLAPTGVIAEKKKEKPASEHLEVAVK